MSVWKVAHGSVIGLAHQNQQTECQDRFLCETVMTHAGDTLIAVIADGAGSTTDGQLGAEIACRTFADNVGAFLNSGDARLSSLNLDFGKLWVAHAQRAITERAELSGKQIRDFASTVVAAVVSDEGAAFYQIGDGGSVFSESGEPGSYCFAIPPTDTEYVNVTEFITDDDAADTIRFAYLDRRVEDLILFSDGIFAVAVDYQTNRPHEPFLRPMIAPLRNANGSVALNEKLETFLGSPKLNEKTDDDKTIILATRCG